MPLLNLVPLKLRVRTFRQAMALSVLMLVILTISVYSLGNRPVEIWYKEGVSREQLLSSSEMGSELLRNISEGVLFDVDPDTNPWRKTPDVLADEIPSPDRCPVYTYVDLESERNDNGQLIETWKRAWWAAGFDPRVLTREHAESHPDYEGWERDSLALKFRQRHRKWFAWASEGAGIFAHYTVVPVNWEDTITMDLLRSCDFTVPSFFAGTEEWFAISGREDVSQVIERLRWSNGKSEDIFEIFDKLPQSLVVHYKPSRQRKMLDGKTLGSMDTAELIDAHLHQSFLKKYPNGIAIVDPLAERYKDTSLAHSILAPAYEFARRVVTCPIGQDWIKSCPPSDDNLEKLEALKEEGISPIGVSDVMCGNPCDRASNLAQGPGASAAGAPLSGNSSAVSRASIMPRDTGAIPISLMTSLPLRGSGHFSIVTLPHPVVALAAIKDNAEVSAFDARRLPRDQWIADLTAHYIPKDAHFGVGPMAMLLRDAIFQVSQSSDILWLDWEGEWNALQSTPAQDEMIEWDLGFRLKKSTPANAPDKTVLDRAVQLVQSTDENDRKIVGAVTAWNRYHTELWSFVQGLNRVKNEALAAVIFDVSDFYPPK